MRPSFPGEYNRQNAFTFHNCIEQKIPTNITMNKKKIEIVDTKNNNNVIC